MTTYLVTNLNAVTTIFSVSHLMVNIVNAISRFVLFLCANNKPFAFKTLVICIYRTSFNIALKQSFFRQNLTALKGLFFSWLISFLVFLSHRSLFRRKSDILAFLSTIHGGLALSVYFLFALFSAAIRYLPFDPMSLQQVLAISRHTVVPFLP